MTVILLLGAMLVVAGFVLAVAGRGLHHEPPIITLLTAPGKNLHQTEARGKSQVG